MRMIALVCAALVLAGPGVARAQAVIALHTGFEPDPHDITVQAGGPLDVAELDSNRVCHGWITDQPTVSIDYTSGDEWGLDFYTSSDLDTVLLVRTPDGQVWCDDDGGWDGGADWVGFDTPSDGRYDVWVGSYAQGGRGPAVLHVSETYGEDDWW